MWGIENLKGTSPNPVSKKVEPPETWTEVGRIKNHIRGACIKHHDS